MRIARIAAAGGSELALIGSDEETCRRIDLAGDGDWSVVDILAGSQRLPSKPPETIDWASLLPPVVPRSIVGVGLNYRGHAAEQGRTLPGEPRLFMKNPRSLAAPFGTLPMHPASCQLDYEAELGVVIGRPIFDCTRDDAGAAIAGWVIIQDYTLRDLVRPETLAIAKGGPGMAPVGPWLTSVATVPLDSIGDLVVRSTVNGELRQESRVADMHFGPVDLVHYIARYMPLGPGDIIATGSPAGSGVGMDPPRWLAPGDVVETEITGLGRLRQQVEPLA
jgi:2-keto-4-pentenoate hydratase/2-oxohepta-3-ene-1,7-dioic acid hydratase in catechol pathway